MRRTSWDGIRDAILGALVVATIVFVFDLLQPSPVAADVIERHGLIGTIGERVTVPWVDEDGLTHMANVLAPREYIGESPLPVVVTQAAYVDDGWLSLHWYLFAAIAGLIIGGPVAAGLRRQPYSEAPIRQVASGAGL